MGHDDLIEWVFKGIITCAVMVGGWTLAMLINHTARNREDLAAHKLHVSENYAKLDVINRIHNRIDEVSNDIKTLLQRK